MGSDEVVVSIHPSYTGFSCITSSSCIEASRLLEKIACMTIHEAIKALRLAKGWSHTKLGEQVALAEGLPKPLAWQTVQQWEKPEGIGTAPKRKRLEFVALVLGTTV
jgi:hypothetical protein